MSDDPITNGAGDTGSDTDRIDYTREFCRDLRAELSQVCERLGELEERIPWATVGERRSLCFRIAEYLEILGTTSADAAGVVRDHVAALTLYLADR